APNQQNLEGIQIVAESLCKPKLVEQGRRGRGLQLLFVPSRVDNSEGKALETFSREFVQKLGKYVPAQLQFQNSPFIDLKTPYVPYYAFSEKLAAREPEQPVASELIAAYTRLATTMVELAPRSSRLYTRFNALPASMASRSAGPASELVKAILE